VPRPAPVPPMERDSVRPDLCVRWRKRVRTSKRVQELKALEKIALATFRDQLQRTRTATVDTTNVFGTFADSVQDLVNQFGSLGVKTCSAVSGGKQRVHPEP
jgi:hypothetical protein